ncbi:MAG: hypothetical protein OEY23_08180 [Acidimicrobiia bacterium]|nr:hypothetical protein [Acidimicrobiia bacterium]
MHAEDAGAPPPDLRWAVNDQFRNRVGCGVATAVGLPVWFAIMALALGGAASQLAFTAAVLLCALSAAVGISAARRFRNLATEIRLEEGAWLRLRGSRMRMDVPVEALAQIEVGAVAGFSSIRLTTTKGRLIRLPGDLDDVDGLVAALGAANPELVVVDHRGEVPG